MISVMYKKVSLNFIKFSRLAIRDSTNVRSLANLYSGAVTTFSGNEGFLLFWQLFSAPGNKDFTRSAIERPAEIL